MIGRRFGCFTGGALFAMRGDQTTPSRVFRANHSTRIPVAHAVAAHGGGAVQFVTWLHRASPWSPAPAGGRLPGDDFGDRHQCQSAGSDKPLALAPVAFARSEINPCAHRHSSRRRTRDEPPCCQWLLGPAAAFLEESSIRREHREACPKLVLTSSPRAKSPSCRAKALRREFSPAGFRPTQIPLASGL